MSDWLDEIKAREAAATETIEIICYEHGGGRIGHFGDPHKGGDRQLVADFYDEANREFYYHARTDIPRLVAEVERQAAEIARMRAALEATEEALSDVMAENTEKWKALKEVEWVGMPKYLKTHPEMCPWCLNSKYEGHTPDCQRQAALAQMPEPPNNAP